ncbi:MAG: MFS family permease [Alcanivorax sp.]|jgi:MFS family permease
MNNHAPQSSSASDKEIFHQGYLRVGGPYAKYVLGLLIIVYTMNLLDRQILAILAEEIKADLGISDSQMGFLYGTSFAVFYAVFGLPLGRLADLWVRKSLIALGLIVWSSMTMLSGTAGGIGSLTFYRFGVGVGEASATPSAYSLLSDWFLPEQRATVLALYTSGAYIGMGLSMFLGGWIVDSWNLSYPQIADAPFALEGWQVTFLIIGVPGVLLGILFSTVKEPQRGFSEGIKSQQNHPHPFKESWQELMSIIPPFSMYGLYKRDSSGRSFTTNAVVACGLIASVSGMIYSTGSVSQWIVMGVGIYALFSWAQSLKLRDAPTFALIFRCRSMIYANLAFPIVTFITYGYALWMAPYLIRKYGVDLSEVGMILGASTAICGGVGVAFGGWMADFLRRRVSQDAHAYMAIITAVLTSALALVILNTDDLKTVYIANAAMQFVAVLWSGAGSGIITSLVLPRMRAAASAFYLAMVTFLGLAMGPYLIGYLSDTFTADGMSSADALESSLGYGLLVFILVIVFSLLMKRHLLEDLQSKEERARAYGEAA